MQSAAESAVVELHAFPASHLLQRADPARAYVPEIPDHGDKSMILTFNLVALTRL